MNVNNAVSNNRGLALEFEDITENLLMKTLKDLLENPKYAENAKIAAQKYKDRPVHPKQSVVYWTEYVARHNGAKHLRAAANDLNFIEYNLIDVYALMITLILILVYLEYKLLRMCVRKVFKSQKPKEKTK
jgi:glucuronosyltransferase